MNPIKHTEIFNLMNSVSTWFDKFYNAEKQEHEYPVKNKLFDELFDTYKHAQHYVVSSHNFESALHKVSMLQEQYDIATSIEAL